MSQEQHLLPFKLRPLRVRGKRVCSIGPKTKAMVLDLKRLLLVGPENQVEITASDVLVLSALAHAPGHKLERWQIVEILGGTDDF